MLQNRSQSLQLLLTTTTLPNPLNLYNDFTHPRLTLNSYTNNHIYNMYIYSVHPYSKSY